MEIEIDEFHALQKQICDLQDCCSDWEKQALDYKAKNIALSGELERTRKALEIAKDTFNWIDETYQTGQEIEAKIWGKVQLAAQKITALTKGDNNE